MSVFKTYEITVDTMEENRKTGIRFSQGDLNTAKLLIRISHNGKTLDITGCDVKLALQKIDGKKVYQDCTIIDEMQGLVEVVLSTQSLALVGIVQVELCLFLSQEQIMISTMFEFEVKKTIMSDRTLQSDNSFPFIQQIKQINNMLQNFDVEGLGQSGNRVLSKIKADGETDDTNILRAELNALNKGDYFITPKGTSIIDDTIFMSMKEGVTLDFSATKFIEGNTTLPLVLRLKNSKVIGLYIDGDRDNKTFDDTQYGTDFLLKVDNDCENIDFIDMHLENAKFCGIMFGHNLKNIRFKNLHACEIGEHVIYKPQIVPLNNNLVNIQFEDVILKNIGINHGNFITNHYVQFLKVGHDPTKENGYCENISVKNINLTQDNSETIAVTVFGVNELRNSYTERMTGDFTSLISGRIMQDVSCHKSYMLRPFYTDSIAVSYEGIKFFDCTFTEYVPHVNLASLYKDCTFEKYFRTSPTTALKSNSLTFENTKFKTDLSSAFDHVLTDINLKNCHYLSIKDSYESTALIEFGRAQYIDGCKIQVNGGCADVKNFGFLFRLRNSNLQMVINDLIATGRIYTSEIVKSVDMQNVLYKFSDGNYTTLSADISASTSTMINVKSSDGTVVLDNYIKGATGTFVDSEGTTINVVNGIITNIKQ